MGQASLLLHVRDKATFKHTVLFSEELKGITISALDCNTVVCKEGTNVDILRQIIWNDCNRVACCDC